MRPRAVDDAENLVDEPAFVSGSKSAAGDAVWLARVSRSDAIHDATPWSRVEGSKVRPDRRRMKPPVFHARLKDCGGIGFPLHVSDAARSGLGDSDAEIEPADAGAEG